MTLRKSKLASIGARTGCRACATGGCGGGDAGSGESGGIATARRIRVRANRLAMCYQARLDKILFASAERGRAERGMGVFAVVAAPRREMRFFAVASSMPCCGPALWLGLLVGVAAVVPERVITKSGGLS